MQWYTNASPGTLQGKPRALVAKTMHRIPGDMAKTYRTPMHRTPMHRTPMPRMPRLLHALLDELGGRLGLGLGAAHRLEHLASEVHWCTPTVCIGIRCIGIRLQYALVYGALVYDYSMHWYTVHWYTTTVCIGIGCIGTPMHRTAAWRLGSAAAWARPGHVGLQAGHVAREPGHMGGVAGQARGV